MKESRGGVRSSAHYADPSAQARRIKAGGNKKTMFTEAWVEFEDKHEARAVAGALNNSPIG